METLPSYYPVANTGWGREHGGTLRNESNAVRQTDEERHSR